MSKMMHKIAVGNQTVKLFTITLRGYDPPVRVCREDSMGLVAFVIKRDATPPNIALHLVVMPIKQLVANSRYLGLPKSGSIAAVLDTGSR